MGPLRWLRAGPSGNMGKSQSSRKACWASLRYCQLCWGLTARPLLICGTYALYQAVTPAQPVPFLHILVRHRAVPQLCIDA